jgi:hypothetical protein
MARLKLGATADDRRIARSRSRGAGRETVEAIPSPQRCRADAGAFYGGGSRFRKTASGLRADGLEIDTGEGREGAGVEI